MIVVWILDAGVEAFLEVCLGSMWLNAPRCWARSRKVIVDCGLSAPFRAFLGRLEPPGVQVVPAPPEDGALAEGRGVEAMWRRTGVSAWIRSLDGVALGEPVLVCDADTAFLGEPDDFPFPGDEADVAIMPGYTLHDGREVATPWLRPSTLRQSGLDEADLAHVAAQLDLSAAELGRIRSYNNGVIGFRAGRSFDGPWRRAYDGLRRATDRRGRPVFAPFMLEQNALSLAIHRSETTAVDLPRRFNFFPPLPPLPLEWPADTAIVHFVNFPSNRGAEGYRRWFALRDRLVELGFIVPDEQTGDTEPAGPRS